MACRSRGGSSRRAASSSTGSASAATWSGRSWVSWASTWRGPATAPRRSGPGRWRSTARGTAPERSAHNGGRAGTHAQPGPQPPSGGAGLDALFGPGGPPGVHRGQVGQPVAFQAVGQLSQHPDPLGQGGVAQPVRVLGGQLLEFGGQRRQSVFWPGGWSNVCSSPWRQPISPALQGKHHHHIWGQLLPPNRVAAARPRVQATPAPGNCMRPDTRATMPAPRTGPDGPRPDPTPAIQVPLNPDTRPAP